MTKIEDLFNKKFSFRSPASSYSDSRITRPFFSQSLWVLDETQHLRAVLETLRSEVHTKSGKKWKEHCAKIDLMSDLVTRMTKMDVELGFRPWLKMTEILRSYPLVDLKNCGNKFNAGFLCEDPGCNITATNHFLKSEKRDVMFKWIATTQNPYHEGSNFMNVGIPDDRFIRMTPSNWYFGPDDRGDVSVTSFIQDFRIKNTRSFQFISADGGEKFLINSSPNKKDPAQLQFCELIIAVNCLKPRGSLLIKLSDLLNSQTCCLVFLMYDYFEEIHLIKPSCSGPRNSEAYAVCLRLKKSSESEIKTLTDICIKMSPHHWSSLLSELSIVPRNRIPTDFMKQYLECCEYFTRFQINALLDDLKLFELASVDPLIYEDMKNLKKKASELFLAKFPVKALPFDAKIVSKSLSGSHPRVPSDTNLSKIKIPTNLCKKVFQNSSPDDNAKLDYKLLLQSLEQSYDYRETVKYFSTPYYQGGLKVLSHDIKTRIYGEHPDLVTNSPWIFPDLLHIYNHLLEKARFYEIWDSPPQYLSDHLEYLHFLDCFVDKEPDCAHGTIFFQDYSNGHLYNHANEDVVAIELLGWIAEICRKLEVHDIICLTIGPPLRRIIAGTIYLLAQLFDRTAILPSSSRKSRSLLTEGMLFVFSNSSSKLKKNRETLPDMDFRYKKFHVQQAVEKILGITPIVGLPVEIVSIFDLLKDESFFSKLYWANYVHLSEKIKILARHQLDLLQSSGQKRAS